MKSYVITIQSIPQSVKSAKRCIDSMLEFDVQMFDAITPEKNPEKIAEEKKIPTGLFKNKFSNYEKCLSAFLSHHSLWELCARTNEEIQIFEHDAVCVGTIPRWINYYGCISLGAPSYGNYKTPPAIGVNNLTSKPYFPGAHAYRLKPGAARALIAAAKTIASPTDVFLNNQTFEWLEEYYPWPVIAKDSFTTIQKETGCLAKHNYNPETYEIL